VHNRGIIDNIIPERFGIKQSLNDRVAVACVPKILEAEKAIGAVVSKGSGILEHLLERREVEHGLFFLLRDNILLVGCSGRGL